MHQDLQTNQSTAHAALTRENEALKATLREIYQRRPADYDLDASRMRAADTVTIEAVLPLVYESDAGYVSSVQTAGLGLTRYMPRGVDASAHQNPMKRHRTGPYVRYGDAMRLVQDLKLGATNEASNFANLMRVSNWLLAHDIHVTPFTEETHGPLASADNIIAAIETLFAQLRNAARDVVREALESIDDFPMTLTEDAKARLCSPALRTLRTVVEVCPNPDWTSSTIEQSLAARDPKHEAEDSDGIRSGRGKAELPIPEYIARYIEAINANLKKQGLNVEQRRAAVTALLSTYIDFYPAKPSDSPAHGEPNWRGALLWALYYHQDANSPIGQPIRELLGMDRFANMTEAQIDEAIRFTDNSRAGGAHASTTNATEPAVTKEAQ